jgi:hypothetical protein
MMTWAMGRNLRVFPKALPDGSEKMKTKFYRKVQRKTPSANAQCHMVPTSTQKYVHLYIPRQGEDNCVDGCRFLPGVDYFPHPPPQLIHVCTNR